MAVMKTRTIKLAHTTNGAYDKVEQVVNNFDGVNEINLDQNKRKLTIEYDLEKIMLTKIEEQLYTLGIELDNGFYERTKRGWNHFTEQNELDNLHIHPTCCSDPKLSHM